MEEEMIKQTQIDSIRMECLRLAVQGREGHAPNIVLAVAKEFLEFVRPTNG